MNVSAAWRQTGTVNLLYCHYLITAYMHSYDVVIIGAGPAGSCAALRLLSLGYRVALVESELFPRPQIGESLSPGIHNIFDYLGAAQLLQEDHCLQQLPAQVIWESTTPLIQTANMRGNNAMVNRGLLDKGLLDLAITKGLTVFQPARYERSDWDGDTWQVYIRQAACQLSISASFLLDARGRRGQHHQQRLLTAPPMVGIWAYTHARNMPAATCVEATENGWLWGSPMHDGRYRIIAFTSPQHLKAQPLAQVYHQMLKKAQLFHPAVHQGPLSYLQSCKILSYAHQQPWLHRRLQLGEAAFAIDPLSSTGVEKAMRFSLQAAIAVNTILKNGSEQMAQQFYEERMTESIVNHTQWTSQYYAQAWPGPAHSFWQERSQVVLPPTLPALPFAQRLYKALQQTPHPRQPPPEKNIPIQQELERLWHGQVQVSAALTYIQVPCVVDDLLEIKTAILHPNLQREIAFLETAEIFPLLRMAHQAQTFGGLLQQWSKVIPLATAAKIGVFLWNKQILCEQ
ncbi:NAD(P)/FAD-dependent oxidoreductase [Chitinophaga sp. 30R24]|uniref:flavin-dependent monooxygenase QhpG n=1 Tax=Chitinophaga sp. 30R24 TaxID=3248838 RepID=UPI003B8F9AEF